MTERQLNVYDVLNRYCSACGAELDVKPTGRRRATCSDRCRQRRRRASRKAAERAAAESFRDVPFTAAVHEVDGRLVWRV